MSMDFELVLGAAVTLVALGSLLLLDRYADARRPGNGIFAPEQPTGWADAMHVSQFVRGAGLAPMQLPTRLDPHVAVRAHSPAVAVKPAAMQTWEEPASESRPSPQPSLPSGEGIAA